MVKDLLKDFGAMLYLHNFMIKKAEKAIEAVEEVYPFIKEAYSSDGLYNPRISEVVDPVEAKKLYLSTLNLKANESVPSWKKHLLIGAGIGGGLGAGLGLFNGVKSIPIAALGGSMIGAGLGALQKLKREKIKNYYNRLLGQELIKQRYLSMVSKDSNS